jgi:hypothetical protein
VVLIAITAMGNIGQKNGSGTIAQKYWDLYLMINFFGDIHHLLLKYS